MNKREGKGGVYEIAQEPKGREGWMALDESFNLVCRTGTGTVTGTVTGTQRMDCIMKGGHIPLGRVCVEVSRGVVSIRSGGRFCSLDNLLATWW